VAALAGFFKTSFTDSLTKLVQPAGLIPAGLFVLLNLAFVLPQAKADGVGAATDFAALDGAWQLVAIAAVVAGLGYLLVSLSGVVLEAARGSTWTDALLSDALVKHRTDTLETLDTTLADEPDPGELIVRRREHPRLASQVSATRIGDTLTAVEQTVFERYGIQLVALAGDLQTEVTKDSETAKALTDSRQSVDTLLGTALVLVSFCIETTAVSAVRGAAGPILLAMTTIPLAWLAYRAAAIRTRDWGDALESAVRLYRDALETALKVPEEAGRDERAMWEGISSGLLYLPGTAVTRPWAANDMREGHGVTVSVTSRLAAELVSATVYTTSEVAAGVHRLRERVRHVLLVSPAKDETPPVDGQVIVHDGRVPRVLDMEGGKVTFVERSVAAAGAAALDDTVVLDVAGFGPAAARVVYDLTTWILEATGVDEIAAESGETVALRVTLRPSLAGVAVLRARHTLGERLRLEAWHMHGDHPALRIPPTSGAWTVYAPAGADTVVELRLVEP
jgi:hypothetical protein